jgi:hypothetical protein
MMRDFVVGLDCAAADYDAGIRQRLSGAWVKAVARPSRPPIEIVASCGRNAIALAAVEWPSDRANEAFFQAQYDRHCMALALVSATRFRSPA